MKLLLAIKLSGLGLRSLIRKIVGARKLDIVFCVLSASETRLLLEVILRRNVVMMLAGVKIMIRVMLNYQM